MLISLSQRLNETLIQAHGLTWNRHKLLTYLEVTTHMHNTIIFSFTSLDQRIKCKQQNCTHYKTHVLFFLQHFSLS
jgi:hypothetical protein